MISSFVRILVFINHVVWYKIRLTLIDFDDINLSKNGFIITFRIEK